ncbi:hypothetical protein MNV49_001040 [Pseudohyphozyma bogoriensis]|nr:hypothetical protein MNV49_001040 [Pseudohyphozyma bogoriensis]
MTTPTSLNDTFGSLPAVVSSLSSAISSLQPQLASSDLNLTQLSSLLEELAVSLSPILSTLTTAQVWAPEIWAIVLLFLVITVYKVSYTFLMRRSILLRAREFAQRGITGKAEGEGYEGKIVDDGMRRNEELRADHELRKKALGIIGHTWNFIIGSVGLALQLVAWRLLVVPTEVFVQRDARLIFATCKLILISYGAELLFCEPHSYILLHHFFTAGVLVAGMVAAYKTNAPMVLRLGTYWILQATLEQTTYGAMIAYHGSNYITMTDGNPRTATTLLNIAAVLMNVTKWIGYPQKLGPIVFVIYCQLRSVLLS